MSDVSQTATLWVMGVLCVVGVGYLTAALTVRSEETQAAREVKGPPDRKRSQRLARMSVACFVTFMLIITLFWEGPS